MSVAYSRIKDAWAEERESLDTVAFDSLGISGLRIELEARAVQESLRQARKQRIDERKNRIAPEEERKEQSRRNYERRWQTKREEILAHQREYYRTHREEILAKNRESGRYKKYYYAHREEMLRKKRERYHAQKAEKSAECQQICP